MGQIKHAVFDVDGTLLDSMGVWHDLAGRYLRSLGVTPKKELGARLKTMSLTQAAPYLIREYGLSVDEEGLIKGINDLVREDYFYKVKLKEGVSDYLHLLKSLGIKLVIASASDEKHIKAALEREGVLSLFSEVLTCAGIGLNKDETSFFQFVAHVLGKLPCEITVFEDALHAVKCAKKAGCHVVGVYDEDAKEDTLEILKYCDVYVPSFVGLGFLPG